MHFYNSSFLTKVRNVYSFYVILESQLFTQFLTFLSTKLFSRVRLSEANASRHSSRSYSFSSRISWRPQRQRDASQVRTSAQRKRSRRRIRDKDEGCPVPGRRHNTRDSSRITQHAQVRGSRLNEILIKPRRVEGHDLHNGTMATKSSEGVGALLPKPSQPRRDNYIEAAARNLARKTCLGP